MPKTDVLMTGADDAARDGAAESAFTLHRLWEAPDRDAFLKEVGPRIRGIATSPGHQLATARPVRAARRPRDRLELRGRLRQRRLRRGRAARHRRHQHAGRAERRGRGSRGRPPARHDPADPTGGPLSPRRDGGWKAPYPLTATCASARSASSDSAASAGRSPSGSRPSGSRSIYHGRSRQADVAYPYHPTLLGLAEACDVLIVITPGGPGTKHSIDARCSGRSDRTAS